MKNLLFPFLIQLAQSPRGVLHQANQTVDDAIAAMTEAETVEDSALAFIQSVPGLIAAAVATATAGGATSAQLAPFTQLSADLSTRAAAIRAALTVNTPDAPVV